DCFSCDTKRPPPIAGDCHAPNTFAIAFQLVETPSRNGRKGSHIGGGRQECQRGSYPFDLIGRQTTRLVIDPEPFQRLVVYRSDAHIAPYGITVRTSTYRRESFVLPQSTASPPFGCGTR